MQKPLKEYVKEILFLMNYAVPGEILKDATAFVEKFSADIIGLNVFHNFYSYLPEGVDDAILALKLVRHKLGTFLIIAGTMHGSYLYVSTSEAAEYIGLSGEGPWDEDMLEFFGFEDGEKFRKFIDAGDGLPLYTGAVLDLNLCPVCHVEAGESHILGCPLEICPWCDGQLTSCNCRFIKLNSGRIDSEAQISELQVLLDQTGRIPFEPDNQRLSYPELTDVLK